MEFRFQHLFLSFCTLIFCLSGSLSAVAAGEKLRLNNEYFEFGVSAGVLNVQDFPAGLTLGVSATFSATEDFFLQYNYQFADVGENRFESDPENRAIFFQGEDRQFRHYDLLLGYKLFQSEFFVLDGYNTIGNLYTVLGIGNTAFGDEDSFSTVVGVGYKVGLTRKWQLRFDFRDYIYRSEILIDDGLRHNTSFTTGVSYLW